MCVACVLSHIAAYYLLHTPITYGALLILKPVLDDHTNILCGGSKDPRRVCGLKDLVSGINILRFLVEF